MENGTAPQNVEAPQNGTAPTEKSPPKPAVIDEKAPDSSDNMTPKLKTTKGKKRKKPKDSTAPRHPLTGYVRFLNDRRDAVRASNPSLSFAEITKMLASEWSNLPAEKKQQYLDAAEQDRERYTREYNAYKQTDAYKIFTQQQQQQQQAQQQSPQVPAEKKLKESSKEEAQKPALPSSVPTIKEQAPLNNNNNNNNNVEYPTNFDIPIFTEEFLDHNKTRDTELRQLRKSNTDYEQQNAILQKHIENMRTGIEKLEGELALQRRNNSALQVHLDHLRSTLSAGFSGVKLPGISEVPNISTIDAYMLSLHAKLLENSSQDANLLATVRDIVGRLEFNG